MKQRSPASVLARLVDKVLGNKYMQDHLNPHSGGWSRGANRRASEVGQVVLSQSEIDRKILQELKSDDIKDVRTDPLY